MLTLLHLREFVNVVCTKWEMCTVCKDYFLSVPKTVRLKELNLVHAKYVFYFSLQMFENFFELKNMLRNHAESTNKTASRPSLKIFFPTCDIRYNHKISTHF
jgi:hypothetical protein